jgi:hypothetical protein
MTDELNIPIPESIVDRVARRVVEMLREEGELNRAAIDAGGWLDTRAAAAYAGCSVNALHKAMARREVEFEQDVAGGKAWFKRSALDAWRRGEHNDNTRGRAA